MPLRPLHRHPQARLRVGLGTWVAIEASAPLPRQAATAIEAAFDAIGEVEDRMHPTRGGSDLAQINAAATSAPGGPTSPRIFGSRCFTVHPMTWNLLEFAQRLFALSAGVFDPCLPCRPGRLSDIELGSGGRVLCHAPVKLDFGGFAKGYAIDRAIDVLVEHGCSSGLVNAGGDLRVFGAQPRTILLREPTGLFRPVELLRQALAVSRRETHGRPREHQGYYLRQERSQNSKSPLCRDADAEIRHGDLRGRFAAPHQAAVIVASQAVAADALTKCVLLCEPQVASRALRGLGGTDIGPQPPASAVAGRREHGGPQRASS